MPSEYLDIGGIRDRHQQCTLGLWWKDQRFEYSETNLIYKGVHRLHDVLDTDTEWLVWKFTYDVSDNLIRIEGPLPGSWNGRASIAWGA